MALQCILAGGNRAQLDTSGVTAGSYGPSANASPAHSGTFSVPYVTVDKYGRVTAASTKTITLPSDNNTDTNVTNTLATTTKAYITGTTSASTNTGTQVFDTGVFLGIQPGSLQVTNSIELGDIGFALDVDGCLTIDDNTKGENIISWDSNTYYFNGTANQANTLTSTLPVSRGGTGTTSWTANRLIYPSASTTFTQLAFPTTAGSVLRQGTSGAPYWTSLSDLKTAMSITDTMVTNTLATATKAYVTGTSSATTNTGTQVFDTGVYLTATAGELEATTLSVNSAYMTTQEKGTFALYDSAIDGEPIIDYSSDNYGYYFTGEATYATNAGSADYVYTVYTTGTTSTTYNLPFTTSSTASGDLRYYIATGLNIVTSYGSTSTAGTAILSLGNSTASGTAGNKYGALRLYGNTAYYYQITGNESYPAADRTIYMPRVTTTGRLVALNASSTAAGSTTQPCYVSSAGIATAMTGALATTYGGTGTTTGEAPSATKLATAVTIDGVSFDGSAAITHYGTCSTTASTAAKVVTCDSTFSLVTGARIVVLFSTSNSATAPTLNVNSTGAYAIVGYGTTPSGHRSWGPTSLVEFVFDGTSWVILSIGREGSSTNATGNYSHAEGFGTTASATGAHAEGYTTEASSGYSHAEGYGTTASGSSAHAEGSNNTASGNYSHAEGGHTTASGNYAHVGGCYTTALAYNTTIGRYNSTTTEGNATTGDAFIIGNGTGSSALSNAFRVTYAGATYGLSAFNSSGADYAEFIKEWYDGNPNSEDRVGYFVTIYDGYLYKADEGDYIVGITSGNPSIVGNGDENYYWRYERDEFNRFVYEDVAEMTEQLDDEGNPIIDENGDIVMVETGNIIKNGRMKISDSYDSSQTYIERKDRPEWDYVGMLGVLPVRDDGTCVAGGYCRCADGGIATKADSKADGTYFVVERITDSVISVILK